MEKELEIYFEDLSEEGQRKVLDFYNIETPEDMNLEVFPLFVLNYEEVE